MKKPHISPSQVATYTKCGEQYRRRYLEHEIIPPSISLCKGRSVHKGSEYNFKQKIDSRVDLKRDEIVDYAVADFDTSKEKEGLLLHPGEESRGKAIVVGEAKDSVRDLAGLYAREVAPKYQPEGVEEGLNPILKHIPNLEGERGPVLFYYATAHFKETDTLAAYEVMTPADIEEIKKRSKSAQSGYSPWKTDPEAMASKTVIRRMLKNAPVSIEMQSRVSRAVTLDEMNEIGKPIDLGDIVDVPESAATPDQVKSSELFNKEPQQ